MRRDSELSRGLSAILREIVTLILPAYPALEAPARRTVEGDVTRYVAAQIRAMPGFLRVPYQLALLAFALLPWGRYGRPFRALPQAKRASYLAWWNDAPVASMRDFVKLIRSSAVLVYFDHALIRQRLEGERQRGRAPAEAHRAAHE